MGKFSNFLAAVCPLHVCIWFPDDNLSKCKWIFSKIGICIDIVKVWFGIANRQNFISFYTPV